jgi:hypothetical protein
VRETEMATVREGLPETLLEVGVWAGLVGCLIRCFILILSICIFLEFLTCHLVIGEQKSHDLCNVRIAAPPNI